MKKIISLIFLLTFILFFLTGCYDAISLEKYHYAIALGIDTSDSTKLKLIVQIASSNNSSDSSSSQSTNTEIFSVDCDSINLGLNIINNYLSKKINLSHCSAIIYSEEFAKKGIKDTINALANNPEIRPNCHILISNSKALDILENISNSGEQFSSRYYDFVINSVESTGYSFQSEFSQFFYAINNDSEIPIANYINLNKEAVQSVGIALFKNAKFEYYLDSLNSLAHLIVSNRLKETVISIPNPIDTSSNIDITLKSGKSKTTNKIKILNGKPFISTNVSLTGKITNMPYFIDNENLALIEKNLNFYLKDIIENYYYTIIKKYNLDLNNFSKMLSSQYLTTTSFNKLNWDQLYKDSFYNVSVISKLYTSLYTKK